MGKVVDGGEGEGLGKEVSMEYCRRKVCTGVRPASFSIECRADGRVRVSYSWLGTMAIAGFVIGRSPYMSFSQKVRLHYSSTSPFSTH